MLSDRILEVMPGMLLLYDYNATIIDIRNPDSNLVVTSNADTQTLQPIKELTEILYEPFQTVRHTHQSCQFPYCHKMDDSSVKVYDVSLSHLDKEYILVYVRHIPEQSVAQIESAHLHRFFVEVLDNIAIPVSVKSIDTGCYVYWSKKAEIFGRTAAEMVGGTENLYMNSEQARTVQQVDRQLAEGKKKQYQGVEKYITNDGREHTFIVTRTLFTFGQEKLILSSALDISELTETKTSLMITKNELAKRNMILTSVLSLAKIVPWGCDLETQTFYCDYNTYHPENVKGPDKQGRYLIPMDRYFASIHPDHRQEAVRMIKELAEGSREEIHETYLVHWFNNREWEWIRIQSSVSRRGIDGRPLQLIGSAQRVTEQKHTELALLQAKKDLDVKNVILSSILGIAQIIPWGGDIEAGIFYCDYNIYHHEGSSGPDNEGRYTIPFKSHFERIHPDYRAHAYDQYIDLIEGQTAEYHEVYPILWNNDREYEWLEIQGSIYRFNEQGKPMQLIGSARVVTSQKQSEESLRTAKEQAERSNMFKSAFLANMSHEIRTPLNAIVGFSELLAQTDDLTEKEEYLSIIHNSNTMLLQLIADILDLSKIEAGTLEFTFADYDLHAIMEELEQTTRMKVDNPAIEITCTNHDTGCIIHTDRNRLMQVLHNFIGNSAKFTQRGHIHFGYRKQNDGRWYFYVEDTGCGIPSDKVDSVFDRFVKLDKDAKGTGLGLAISKSIIERLGGEIGVFSAEGHGSTFWFVLPAGSITSSNFTKGTGEISPTPCCQKPGQTTILVAEDDPANYKLFEAMLKNTYKLLHAWNGSQAIEMYREHTPDIILMDIKMPKMDGYQATAAIRKLSTSVPIVAVTAFAYPEDMRKILSNGFNGCLPKPVSADNLKKKILELCCCCQGIK